MERTWLVMDKAGYQAEFAKKPPNSRGPKVPTLMLPDDHGNISEHYAFYDPCAPHRRLVVREALGEEWMTQRIGPSARSFQAQPEQVFNAAREEAFSGCDIGGLLNSHALCSIDDHLQKVNPAMYAQKMVAQELALAAQQDAAVASSSGFATDVAIP